MKVEGAPSAVLAVEELVGTGEFLGVIVGVAAVGAAPVLDDVPVGALAAVAGGDKPLAASSGVEAADKSGAFLGKVTRQDALVLQAPKDDGRRVAALLHPTYKQTFKVFSKLRRVIPDMG